MWDYEMNNLSDLIEAQSLIMAGDSLQEMVDFVVNSKTLPDKFALVGHSMGSWVGAATAALHPERITKLVLMDGWARTNAAKATEMKVTLKALQAGQHQQVLAQHCPNVFYANNANFSNNVKFLRSLQESLPESLITQQWQAMVKDNDIRHLLPKIQCPTLVIHGRHDPWFDLDENLFLVQSIAHAQFSIVEDAAHGTPIEQPQATTALLRLFLGN
ncbi:Beta-ketoadipate enol-lactone hydrolase [Synechocystis sp. PCC 6714]|nr:Beta-ketoadipate enol-lactone hydrolase [Synechocystis sp. PCC 6714]